MVTVTVAILIIVLLGLGGALAWILSRQYGDERQSVIHYQQALDTLRQVSDRVDGGGHVRTIGPVRAGVPDAVPDGVPDGASSAPRTPLPEIEPGGEAGGIHAGGEAGGISAAGEIRPGSGPALVFDDAVGGLVEPAETDRSARAAADGRDPFQAPGARRGPGASSGSAGRPGDYDPAHAAARRRRTRIVTAGAAVVLLLLVLLVLSTAGGSPSAHRGKPSLALKRGSSAASLAHGSTRSRHSGTTSTRSKRRGGTVSHSKHSSTSGSSTPSVLTAVSSSAAAGSYQAPSGSYTVVVGASTGDCWVMAREVGTGQVLWTGTLTPGESQKFSASGQVSVDLGAATVSSVTIDGKQVELPSGYQSPFTMTFIPS